MPTNVERRLYRAAEAIEDMYRNRFPPCPCQEIRILQEDEPRQAPCNRCGRATGDYREGEPVQVVRGVDERLVIGEAA